MRIRFGSVEQFFQSDAMCAVSLVQLNLWRYIQTSVLSCTDVVQFLILYKFRCKSAFVFSKVIYIASFLWLEFKSSPSGINLIPRIQYVDNY